MAEELRPLRGYWVYSPSAASTTVHIPVPVGPAPTRRRGDVDGDGLGDAWEQTHFGDLPQTACVDFDGDGLPNLRELIEGQDPTEYALQLELG